jgi:excisionase family DNA binding protein
MSLSVAEAAERLGVHRSRVEQMLWAGQLSGRKSGRLWLVDDESVADARVHPSVSGRPMAPGRAWALLDLLDGGSAPWLAPVARSQVRAKLSELGAADASQWRALLRARARVVQVRVHPSAINRVVKSLGGDVVVGGSARAIELGADIVDLDPLPELYVRSERWPEVARRWHMHEVASNANLRVHLPRDVWIFGSRAEAPPAPIAADLLESAEPRSVEAGLVMLRGLLRQYRAAGRASRSR